MTDDRGADVVIEVSKNRRDRLDCSLSEFTRLARLRVLVDDGTGNGWGCAGLSFRAQQLDDVIALLERARDEAKAMGLLE